MYVVLYRWNLKPEQIKQFKEGWSEIIHRNVEHYGAQGSILHKADDGSWVSYSQWSNKECWLAASQLDDSNEEARKKMACAILKAWPPLPMVPVLDHLISDEMLTPEYL